MTDDVVSIVMAMYNSATLRARSDRERIAAKTIRISNSSLLMTVRRTAGMKLSSDLLIHAFD